LGWARKEAVRLFDAPKEQILKAIEKIDPTTREGVAHLSLDDKHLIEHCGHYLIDGSEYLMVVAAELRIMTGRDFFPSLRREGVPTVFECEVPVNMIADHGSMNLLVIALHWKWKRQSCGMWIKVVSTSRYSLKNRCHLKTSLAIRTRSRFLTPIIIMYLTGHLLLPVQFVIDRRPIIPFKVLTTEPVLSHLLKVLDWMADRIRAGA
jgi:hypothetical protein